MDKTLICNFFCPVLIEAGRVTTPTTKNVIRLRRLTTTVAPEGIQGNGRRIGKYSA